MRRRSILPLFLPFLALLGGCPVWGNSNGGSNLPPGVCITHGDCDPGSYCDASLMKCLTSSSCTNDASCASFSGYVCDFRSTCVPKTPNACRGQADCTGATVCVEGFCRDANTAVCQFDYECGGGRKCVDSACVAQCTSNGACGSDETCDTSKHYCVPSAATCATTDDCSGGAHCVDGRCLKSCSGSATCSNAADRCESSDSFCRSDWQPRAFCSSNTQCTSPSTCDLADHVCRLPCTYDATSTADDTFCMKNDAQFVKCEADGFCHTASEQTATCALQSQCTTTQSCVDGSCQ